MPREKLPGVDFSPNRLRKGEVSWPAGTLPRRMTRELAAYYCGDALVSFAEKVRSGLYPGPDDRGRFDRKLLDDAIADRTGPARRRPK